MKKALIVVDMQKAFQKLDACKSSFETATPNIIKAIERFHARKEPVIFTRTSEALKLGKREDWELISDLGALPTDTVINKDFQNAFWKTPLESVLRDLSVTSVTICGCFSMACVYLSHNGALERGFDSKILEKGTISSSPKSIALLSTMADSVSLEALQAPALRAHNWHAGKWSV